MINNELRQALVNIDIKLNTENIVTLKNIIKEELIKNRNTSKAN